MSGPTLAVRLFGLDLGEIRRDSHGKLSLHYHEAWRTRPGAGPLSLSLPLTLAEHPHSRVDPYLWGLLPDSAQILDGWGRRFGVSKNNAFALLRHVGEDCPGAVQLRSADQERAATAHDHEIIWLTERDLAERIRSLRQNPAATRTGTDTGQFSLGGAQAKTALYLEDGRWGVPSGRIPTTHILKPPVPGYDGHVENEHFCLSLARALGLASATSWVARFEDEPVIVVERFDRARTSQMAAAATGARAAELTALAQTQPILRIHQEDMGQALGRHPNAKYQSEGGPGPREIVEVLRTWSGRPTEDVAAFLDALILQWLIGGTDAHAKNYAVLHSAQGRVRLAPLYDVASALPYDHVHPRSLKLAMKVGPEYRLHNIGRPQWSTLARELRVPEAQVMAQVHRMCAEIADRASDVRTRLRAEGLTHPILDTLVDVIGARAARCQRVMHAGDAAVLEGDE